MDTDTWQDWGHEHFQGKKLQVNQLITSRHNEFKSNIGWKSQYSPVRPHKRNASVTKSPRSAIVLSAITAWTTNLYNAFANRVDLQSSGFASSPLWAKTLCDQISRLNLTVSDIHKQTEILEGIDTKMSTIENALVQLTTSVKTAHERISKVEGRK